MSHEVSTYDEALQYMADPSGQMAIALSRGDVSVRAILGEAEF